MNLRPVRLRALALAGLLGWLLAASPPLYADDACSGCPPPSSAQIQAAVRGKLEVRSTWFGRSPDRIYLDKGECRASMISPPEITPLYQWLVLRAQGEVWNCPHSKSHDTVRVQAAKSDNTQWTTQTSGGFQLSGLVAEVKAAITRGETTGVTITEVTEVSKTIIPAYCLRIPWQAYFLVGAFKAEASFKITQRWAWWTKNATTGSTVHAKGNIIVNCGTADLVLTRSAPLAGFFHLQQRGCDDEECGARPERIIGWFPPLPEDLPPPDDIPRAPDDEDPGGGEGEGEDEDGDEGEDGPGDIGPGEDEPPSEYPESSEDLGEPPGGPVPDPLAGSDS